MKTLFYTFLLTLLFFSCGNDDGAIINPPSPSADSYSSLSEVVEALKTEGQTFTISDPSVANTITGEDGTVLEIGANTFTDDDNNTITSPITVELKEYLTLNDMILGNVQTVSNQQILVTGGSFEVSYTDGDGNSVNANPWNIQAKIPVQTDITGYENDMQYYTGERTTVDGREMVNWDLQPNTEFWFDDGLFNIFGLEQGLANCDVLYDMASENPTQFEVSITNVTDYGRATVWMIIEDFPSVVMLTQLNDTEDAFQTYEDSIPVGLNATLLAIYIDEDDYLQFGSLPITVAGDDMFTMTVDYGTTAELTALIQSLTN